MMRFITAGILQGSMGRGKEVEMRTPIPSFARNPMEEQGADNHPNTSHEKYDSNEKTETDWNH